MPCEKEKCMKKWRELLKRCRLIDSVYRSIVGYGRKRRMERALKKADTLKIVIGASGEFDPGPANFVVGHGAPNDNPCPVIQVLSKADDL